MRRILAIVLLLLIGLPAVASESVTERVLRSAGYEFRYFGRDLGDETFTISRTPNGYRIEATLRLDIDGQIPSEATYELDENRRLLRASYRELTPNGAVAEYVVDDGVLIARGLGGRAHGEVRVPLEPGAVVTGPHYVTDFFVLHPLDLPRGGRHEQVAYTFGFDGWMPTRCILRSRHTRGVEVRDMAGRRVDTTEYRCTIVTESKTFKTRSFLDADGVSVRIKVGAPIGSMNVILD